MSCPSEEELFHLVDGGLVEDRSRAVRAHVATCSRCTAELDGQERLLRRVASPLEEASQLSTASVMSRLDRSAPVPLRSRARAVMVSAGLLVAAASAALFFSGSESGFQARGSGTADAWSVEVVVKSLSSADPLEGAVVPANAPFVVSYRSVGARPAYLMVFVVDSQGVVHWLYPAYTQASTDPQSVALVAATTLTALPEAIVPEAPAPGGAVAFVLLTHDPQRVSSVEALRPIDAASLRSHFPGARVDVHSFVIGKVMPEGTP